MQNNGAAAPEASDGTNVLGADGQPMVVITNSAEPQKGSVDVNVSIDHSGAPAGTSLTAATKASGIATTSPAKIARSMAGPNG